MSLHSKTRLFAVLATALAFFASISGTLSAAWEKVQDCPTVYRDTRTNLEWTVTLGPAGSNAQAQCLVQRYGFRLPTCSELVDVINNSGGANQLCLQGKHHDAYETSDPCTLVGVHRGCAVVKARRVCSRTWVVGVRNGLKIIDWNPFPDPEIVPPDQPKPDEPKPDEPKPDEPKPDEPKPDEPKPDEPKPDEPTDPTLGKLYVLSVWGEDEGNIPVAFKTYFDNNMEKAGMTLKNNKDNFVADYISLVGPNATSAKVLDACKQINQKSGKNDVIFVYISSHAVTMRLDEKDQLREHVLLPQLKNGDYTPLPSEQDFAKQALLRSDIINALNYKDHRLVVLITDSCSKYFEPKTTLVEENILLSPACDPAPGWVQVEDGEIVPEITTDSYFRLFLRTNKGFVNWNSSSPVEVLEGESSFTCLTEEKNAACGTFMNPFLSLISRTVIVKETQVTITSFFNTLQKITKSNFATMKNEGLVMPGVKIDYNTLMGSYNKVNFTTIQVTQTVYDFGDSGKVREDVDRKWPPSKDDKNPPKDPKKPENPAGAGKGTGKTGNGEATTPKTADPKPGKADGKQTTPKDDATTVPDEVIPEVEPPTTTGNAGENSNGTTNVEIRSIIEGDAPKGEVKDGVEY